jgi:hypothetical protein
LKLFKAKSNLLPPHTSAAHRPTKCVQHALVITFCICKTLRPTQCIKHALVIAFCICKTLRPTQCVKHALVYSFQVPATFFKAKSIPLVEAFPEPFSVGRTVV